MNIAITTIYAGLFGLLLIVLSALVVRARRSADVGMGTGGNVPLERAIRAHANFAEYVPLALLLLLVAELGGANTIWLHANALALLAGRTIHAWGLSHKSGVSFGRFWGTLLTWLVVVLLALTDLYLGIVSP